MRYVAIAVGAMLGANLRFILASWSVDRLGVDFPYGTFIVNVSGSFLIGVFLSFVGTRASVNPLWRLFFATGFLGGYTTFSSYAWEALVMAEGGAWAGLVVYVGGSNCLGLVGVWLGARLARLSAG